MAKEKPIIIPGFYGGIEQGQPRDLLDNSQSPNMQNFYLIDNVLTKRPGYVAEANAVVSSGNMLEGNYYEDPVSGKSRFWSFGDEKVLQKTSLGGAYIDVTGGETIISGADQYWSTVEQVDLSDYKNYLIAAQNHTDPLTALNGTLGQNNESVVYYTNEPDTALNRLLGAEGYNDAAGTPDHLYHRCKWVTSYDNRIFLLNTYECVNNSPTWLPLPYRIRFSDKAEFNAASNWDASNSIDLRGKSDTGSIWRGDVLRNVLVVFMQRAIFNLARTDNATVPIRSDIMVSGEGLHSPRLLARTPDSFIFVGNKRQIYQYFGGRDLRPIGDPIKEEFFSDLNKTKPGSYFIKRRAFSVTFDDINAIGFVVPTSSTTPDRLYVYFYNQHKWYKFNTAADFVGVGIFPNATTSGSYDNIPIFGGSVDEKQWRWDYTADNDDDGAGNTAIDAWVMTKEFILNLDTDHQTVEVSFEASGDGAASSVGVSLTHSTTKNPDDGAWIAAPETITLSSDWNKYNIRFNTNGYLTKLMFRNKTASQKLKLGRVQIRTDGLERGNF